MERGTSPNRATYSYDIHGLLKISSYSPVFIPNYFRSTLTCDQQDIILRLRKGREDPDQNFTQIASGLYYKKDERLVVSSVRIFGVTISWSLKQLWETPTEIALSREYEILSKTLLKMPISTVFPIQAYVQHVLHLKLLSKNHTFLVGGCFEPNDNSPAIIISSMGEMGKTTTTLKALREVGGKYLGDDMTIINKDGTIYAYPKPLRSRRFNTPLISVESHVPPIQVLGSQAMIKKVSKVGAVCLLERGKRDEVKLINREEALGKLLAISRKLLPYHMERTVLAYLYMDNSQNLSEVMQKETRVLRNFLKHADCYVLTCRHKDPTYYIKSLRAIADEYK